MLPLTQKQTEFCFSTARFRAFIGGRGSGKTHAGVADLLLRSKPNRKYLVLSPTMTIAEDGVIPTLHTLTEQLGILKSVGGRHKTFTLINDARLVCRTGHRPDFLRSGSYSGCLLDEGCYMHPSTPAIVLAALRENGGKDSFLTVASTPKGKHNWVYGWFCTGRPSTFMVQSCSRDNPMLSQEHLDQIGQFSTEDELAQEFEGQWIDVDGEDTQVIKSDWVEQSQKAWKTIDLHTLPPLDTLGVDVAHGGSSRTVLVPRHGNIIPRLSIYPGRTTPRAQDTVNLILPHLDAFPGALVNVDATEGTGAEVCYKLKEARPNARVQAIVYSGQVAKTHMGYRFQNKRALMYWALRECLNPGKAFKLAIPDNYELAAELTAVHYDNAASGILLESKKKIAALLRRSPDLADALALTTLSEHS